MSQWHITENQVHTHIYIGLRCSCFIHRDSSCKSHLHPVTSLNFESSFMVQLNEKEMMHTFDFLFILSWHTLLSMPYSVYPDILTFWLNEYAAIMEKDWLWYCWSAICEDDIKSKLGEQNKLWLSPHAVQ